MNDSESDIIAKRPDDMTYFAHSENSLGTKHELRDHLVQTAQRTKAFAPAESWRECFYLAGLLHDAGKFQDGFQEYLEKGKPRTPHAGIGSYVASMLGKECIPHQFAIQGHHAGLHNNEERLLADRVPLFQAPSGRHLQG
ncbi:MAG TPA: CRISPR-associated endonuclease Cas3'' [Bacteroidota bacterium]